MIPPLTINLRHLAKRDLRLEGTIPANHLGLNELDPMIRVPEEIGYRLEVQKLDQSLLVQGHLSVPLECECVRCLKKFTWQIELDHFAVDLPLEGEEAVVEGDFVDLTPYVREDIVLAFPQHPLCEPGCVGLKKPVPSGNEAQPGKESQTTSSVWAVLNELKL
jgi:uncharacterized metal-binding protein YceD (DUF177 family)